MKLIIAGSRTLKPSYQFIASAIRMLDLGKHGLLTEVVSGCCEGVDQEGEHFASHMKVPVKHFEADWKKYGKSAEPLRNREMAKYGDVLLVIWDGASAGSGSMKKEMLKLNKPVYEVILKTHGKTEVW